MKTGIFGGTFNPIHFGHLRSAEEAREKLGLDRVIFIPCFLPPHKEDEDLVDPEKRMKMLELALEGNPHFETSDMELKRGGRSFSIDTLKALKKRFDPDEELFFIIGTDSFTELGTWFSYGELFQVTNFVVAARPGYIDTLKKKSPIQLLPVDIQAEFCYDCSAKLLKHQSGKKTYFLETTLLDISSTKIREDVSNGLPIRYLVPREVERFIMEEGLYRNQLQ